MQGVRRAGVALLVVALVALAVPFVAPAGASAADDEWTFVDLINDARAEAGIAPVAVSVEVREVARRHAATMADDGRIFHRDDLSAGMPASWLRIGENVGRGGDAQPIHDAFMASTGHRANILDPLFNYVGVGVVERDGVTYVTELFMQAPSGLLTDAQPVCGSAQSEPDAEAPFHPLRPARIVDTRIGLGASGKVGAVPILPKVLGVGGVPSAGVSAVLLNVTVTEPASPGHLVVHPCGTPTPNASNLNFEAGEDVANLVAAKLNSSGRVAIQTPNSSTHVVADVVGWYGEAVATPGATLRSVVPSRVLDTRAGVGAAAQPVGRAATIDVTIAGRGGVPASGAEAVLLNITATEPSGAGFLTVWPGGEARPYTSTLNFVPGETVANLVAVRLGANGAVRVFNNVGTTHVVADVVGWFAPAGTAADTGEFHALSPARILDTRTTGAKLGQGATAAVAVTGRAGVPESGVTAVVLNVTVTEPTWFSHLTAWPAGHARPLASNLNYSPGQTVPNLVTVKVGEGGGVHLFNNAGATHVVADVVGWYS